MNIKFKMVFCVLLCITSFCVEFTLSQNSTHKFAPLRQMIVSINTIFIGGAGGIAVLGKDNMTEKTDSERFTKNWLLLYDERRDELIQCREIVNNISYCSSLNPGFLLQKERVKSHNMTVDLQNIPTYSIVNVKEVNTSIVVIGVNSAKIQNISYGILSFNLTDFSLFQTELFGKGPMNIELADSENYTLAFKSSFFHAPHVFFFFQVHVHNTFESSRIGKLCLNYEKKSNKTGFYHSYEDMNMTCTHRGITLRKIEYALDDGESVIVLFLHNRSSVICVYSWDDINIDFLESRKSKLPCGNTTEDGEYFEFTRQQNRHVDCFVTKENETVCDKAENVCEELNGDFCSTAYHYTLVGGRGIEKIAYYAANTTITALDILQTDNKSVLYFGTIDGELGRVFLYLEEEKPGEPKVSVLLEATSRILHVKVEKERAYYLTENKIDKIDFKDCSGYTDCKQCMDSLTPYCGWGYTEKSCTKNNSDPVLWISPETGFCIHFTNISNRIQINTEKNTSIDFTIMVPPDVTENIEKENIRCKVNRSEGNITLYRNMGQCKIDIRTLMTGDNKFEIKYQEVILAEALIEFYKCRDLKTCKECVKRRLCSWDPINLLCGKPESILPFYKDDLCPHLETNLKFDLRAKRHKNLTIPVREFESNLTDNMPSSNYTCEISQDGSIVNTVEVLWGRNHTYFTCMGVQLNESVKPYIVRLKFNDFYFDNEVTLNVYTCDGYEDCSNSQYVKKCQRNNNVTVEKIYPVSGPVNGGTSITVTVNNEDDEPEYFFIDDAECTNITEEKEKKFDEGNDTERSDKSDENVSSFSCITRGVSEPNNGKINMSFKGCPSPITKNTYFTYKNPGDIQNFYPRKGILAGNTTLTITGQNISFEGPDRYNIELCGVTCIECRILDSVNMNDSKIMCKTGESNATRNLTKLVVVIDSLTTLQLTRTFQYLPDPTFDISNETLKAIESGGSTFTINGDGFNNVGQITVERVDEPCEVPSDKQAVCQTPEKLPNQPNVQTVTVNFDGIARAFEINYVDDPSFERFDGVNQYEKESSITIKGKNILNGARFEDYNIQVGLDGKCLISGKSDIDMDFIKCVPPKNVPRTNKSDVNTVHVIVEVGRIEVYIGDLQYQEDVKVLAIVVGVLAAALVIAVTIGILAVVILRKKKRKAIKEFKMELMTREEMVRKASREEFADAQMTMRSIKSDLFTSKVPFCDYQTYVFRQLFPNQDITTNPLLQDLEISGDKNDGIKTAMDNLEILLSNKHFLKSLVQTLDRPNMLSIQEKAHFSSVLSISLMGNMRLFFDLIYCLMVDVIRSASKKQQKVLFRRFESITLRLMANWLQIGLYGQLTSNCGMQLFMLYKAVQTIIEMAPIDALTSNSKNTIAEEKLLKMRIEHQSFTLHIDLNGNSDQHHPVRILDCDTISQVKQKCCEQIYKNKPASEIPHIDELSLEWQEGRAGKLTLADIDNTNERKNGLLCLNTLNHYMVKDNSRMALIYKQHEHHTVNVNSTAFQAESLMSEDITLLMPENAECSELEVEKCHLETNLSNLPDGQSNTDADFGYIFLNRLFLTKLLLSDCIDTTFESLIDPQSLSIPIRYFIGVLDRLGKTYGVEQDVLQSWKNECYATRVWAPLIGKTDILFDVSVPAYVEPCMDILRQVFVESFTQTAHKVNKESPPQKLLFHKDIPRYRKLIGPFFIRLEPVTDKEFESEMDEISDKQKSELRFSRQSVLQQLYNLYIGKYKSQIINDLEDIEEASNIKLASKLDEVIKLMEETSTTF